MWDLIVSVPDHCLPFYFVYNSSLKSVYIGHTLRTCSGSSSISSLQKGHNLSNGKRSYRPVSTLIGATPQ